MPDTATRERPSQRISPNTNLIGTKPERHVWRLSGSRGTPGGSEPGFYSKQVSGQSGFFTGWATSLYPLLVGVGSTGLAGATLMDAPRHSDQEWGSISLNVTELTEGSGPHALAFGKALSNTIDLEQNSVTFDTEAMTLLGRIFERGHATCDELAAWMETPEEWIAFSRLQRSRLLNDSGTEFTVSRDGRRLVVQMLSESD